ncbi:hypothetical protein CIPAW_11G107000 [Carya illinoinensis]|uniref:Uncharacterized protein n=1 Tax=Carya illinoinensis TaxID=32201 RepID=A0A8T1P3G4_CARIL|nr:hypothetical protein CIPAW_11G107000 [Carya illinoinensis]
MLMVNGDMMNPNIMSGEYRMVNTLILGMDYMDVGNEAFQRMDVFLLKCCYCCRSFLLLSTNNFEPDCYNSGLSCRWSTDRGGAR